MTNTDIKEQIADEVRSVTPLDTAEEAHIADALDWIASGANIFRIAAPDKPPKHLVAFLVVVDTEHHSILLGEHTKAQLWLPNGGHVELGEHPRQTVIREAREEVNLEAKLLNRERPLFVTIDRTVGLIGAGHTDVSLWYILRGDVHEPLQFDRSEFNDMNWFSFDEILQSHPAIFNLNMHRFTRKLRQHLAL